MNRRKRSPCSCGVWRKCAYNPKSRYPMFHVVPDTSTEGQRLFVFLVLAAVALFFFFLAIT
jgi:hypothetical protein